MAISSCIVLTSEVLDLSHVDNCTGIVETWVDENVIATS